MAQDRAGSKDQAKSVPPSQQAEEQNELHLKEEVEPLPKRSLAAAGLSELLPQGSHKKLKPEGQSKPPTPAATEYLLLGYPEDGLKAVLVDALSSDNNFAISDSKEKKMLDKALDIVVSTLEDRAKRCEQKDLGPAL